MPIRHEPSDEGLFPDYLDAIFLAFEPLHRMPMRFGFRGHVEGKEPMPCNAKPSRQTEWLRMTGPKPLDARVAYSPTPKSKRCGKPPWFNVCRQRPFARDAAGKPCRSHLTSSPGWSNPNRGFFVCAEGESTSAAVDF